VDETANDIARDLAAVARIDSLAALLQVVCKTTSMGFAAVARVSDSSWTACAVHDEIGFGLKPGGQLEIGTTLCLESRAARAPVVIDHASIDPVYASHPTPRIYGIESYISVPIVLKSGEYFGNLCAIDPAPARPSRPEVLAMFELFANLIAMHLDDDRLRAAQARALLDEMATGQLRDQFIAVLGHDLRNPLAAVSASAALLLRASKDEKVTVLAQRIATSSRRMAALIDDVLDLARGRLGGGIGIHLANVEDLGQALRDVVAELQAVHPGRSIDSQIWIDAGVKCDRSRIQQLATNLLANALTHGSATTPVVFSAVSQKGEFVLTVTNHGEPIPAESQARVFEPFWRSSASPARSGLGLGLFICAEIVKAHGGSLELTSSATAGTTFGARLPCVGARQPALDPKANPLKA